MLGAAVASTFGVLVVLAVLVEEAFSATGVVVLRFLSSSSLHREVVVVVVAGAV